MTKAEVQKRVTAIFSSNIEFEKHVLDIQSNSDRVEVMQILANRLIRILLKEELSFIHMKDLNSFKFSLITNLLFRELASEWVSYAQEFLYYERSDALEVIQEKGRVLFLLSLSREYFTSYKIYFVQEIADTFIELIESMPTYAKSNALIDEVLQSDFVKTKNVSVVQSYSQLWRHVKNAQFLKKKEMSRVQIKVDQAKNTKDLKKYEYEYELLNLKSLAHFNEALQRLRNAMIMYMMGIKEYKR